MGWNGWFNLERFLNDGLWKCILAPQFSQLYFKRLEVNLQNECVNGKMIFPSIELIFNALNLTPFETVKVVIIGQDPYPGYGQAMGLAFSVPIGIQVPCSLKNIYKMIYKDPKIPGFVISNGNLVKVGKRGSVWIPDNGCLMSWAQQGVLLLNSTLTVEAGDPESHVSFGWQYFTDEIIRIVSECHNHVVFILMGNFAKTKKKLINPWKHKIIETTHPASRALYQKEFQKSYCFSACNAALVQFGLGPVHWNWL